MSTEQTENARALALTIHKSTVEAVENNKPHATATTNKWKDAMFAIEQASKSLGMLLFQLQNFSQVNAAGIVSSAGVVSSLEGDLQQLEQMNLVFSTDMRLKSLKKAKEAVQECLKSAHDIQKSGSAGNNGAVYATGQRGGASPSSGFVSTAGMSNKDILNAPLPTIQKGTVELNRGAGNDLKVNSDGTFEKPKLGTSIKPSTFLTFSSAESSASARLGISGKCSTCGAARDHSAKFCTGCGKNSNIIFE